MKLTTLNETAERVKLFIDGQLSRRFRMPVICSDETARVIAAAFISKGGDSVVWLNGNQVRLSDLQLSLQVELRSQQEIGYQGKQQTLESE